MSEQDAEVVREMLTRFNRGDYDGSTALLHDQIELQQEIFQIFEVRDGQVFRCNVFWREPEAREAAGLAG